MTTGRSEGFDASHIPFNSVGDPTDIGDAPLYPTADTADYFTVADVVVDGGRGALVAGDSRSGMGWRRVAMNSRCNCVRWGIFGPLFSNVHPLCLH